MGSLVVRNLPDDVYRALKHRAANAGRSTEAEVRLILEAGLRRIECCWETCCAGCGKSMVGWISRAARSNARVGRRFLVILLDTHVISKPLRSQGNPAVTDWLNVQLLETLYLSTITSAEVRYGLASLPEGKKKRGMLNGWEDSLLPLFSGRILLFDEAASSAYPML